ncbi:hypothetical protein IWW37_002455 [Coemansia sp. RSA 2050]|nr:hypothetical protein IWW37_002455 [Coemansia sp. RSA 2050]KAJ2736430.1 hypothetical protein IW152_000791 [Coemansia sp. BCRC 34962]
MTRGNRLEFELDQPDILLHGMTDDAPSTVFSGRLIANLSESIRVKGLKMVLEGHERLEWEYLNDGAMSTFHRVTTPIAHRWDFFTTADGRKVETWEAGCHKFPFSIVFPGNLPETLSLPYANVSYQLKATLRRTGIMPNISAKRDITVKRDLSADGTFGTGAINVESRWREKLEFRIASDADTFTPGDLMHAKFTFQPLVKNIHLTKIGVVLKEYVRCHTPRGDAEKTVSRVAASAEIVPDDVDSGNYLEEAAICDSLYQYATPFPMCHQAVSAVSDSSDQEVPRYSAVPSASDSPTLSLSRSSTPSPPYRSNSAPVTPIGVDLTHAVEEHIRLQIPTELRRLQYDHISSYIEVTHKLKFSIHFKDPDNSLRTLWISVPVSVVPVINDDSHGLACELPTYANAALDERIAVASAGPSPPTYDAVITEPLSRVASLDPQPLPLGISPTIASTIASTCSTEDMPSIDISPPSDTESATASGAASPAAEDYHEHSSVDISEDLLNLSAPGPVGITCRHVSLSHRTVDDSRPPVCPDAVHSFFHQRLVVFPASAEATPVHSPYQSPIITPVASSPVLKSTDEIALMLTNMRLFSSNGRTM